MRRASITVVCPECGKWPMYLCRLIDHSPCACPCHDVEGVIHSLRTEGANLNKEYPELAARLNQSIPQPVSEEGK